MLRAADRMAAPPMGNAEPLQRRSKRPNVAAATRARVACLARSDYKAATGAERDDEKRHSSRLSRHHHHHDGWHDVPDALDLWQSRRHAASRHRFEIASGLD